MDKRKTIAPLPENMIISNYELTQLGYLFETYGVKVDFNILSDYLHINFYLYHSGCTVTKVKFLLQ